MFAQNWSTLTWSKSIKAISKLSRRTNLEKTGEKVQMEGLLLESLLDPCKRVTRLLLSPNKQLVMWKFPPLPECSTAGNSTGNSSQSLCRRESEGDLGNQRPGPSQPPSRCQAIQHDDRVHGSNSCSRRSQCSLSGSTYRRPTAYHS